MKFTDEELSRILSAHEAGLLIRYTPGKFIRGDGEHGCALEIARGWGAAEACDMEPTFTNAFDREYRSGWTATELLRWLEAQGVA